MIAESRERLRRDFVAKEELGIEKGLKQGREETIFSVARNMLRLGQPVETIAQVTGLPREKRLSLMH